MERRAVSVLVKAQSVRFGRALALRSGAWCRVSTRFQNLRHPERGPFECHPGLPALSAATTWPVTLTPATDQDLGWWDMIGPGKTGGYGPFLRRRREQPGDATVGPKTRIRPKPGALISPARGRRLGACPGPPSPTTWASEWAAVIWQPGRHAGSALGDHLPGPRAPRDSHCRGAQPDGREHRLQRRGAAGHPYRPGFSRRPLLRARRASWRGLRLARVLATSPTSGEGADGRSRRRRR